MDTAMQENLNITTKEFSDSLSHYIKKLFLSCIYFFPGQFCIQEKIS